jgi:hypothetical protein
MSSVQVKTQRSEWSWSEKVWNFGLQLPLSTVGDCDLGARSEW